MNAVGLIVGGKYKLMQKIGAGKFGDIYSARTTDINREVCVKIEIAGKKRSHLKNEWKVYKILNGAVGIASMYHKGTEGKYHILVMELLGPSLEQQFIQCKKNFSLETQLLLGIQSLERLATMHSHGYIHRDIKPDNFAVGRGEKCSIVYIIDFGLVKPYIDLFTQVHIPYKENCEFVGTAKFAAINSHMGIEQSRRDDLEALGYQMLYFFYGNLPWSREKADIKEEELRLIMDKKMEIHINELCFSAPKVFLKYMQYVKAMEFDKKPDYKYLKSLFEEQLSQITTEKTPLLNWEKMARTTKRKSKQFEEAPDPAGVIGMSKFILGIPRMSMKKPDHRGPLSENDNAEFPEKESLSLLDTIKLPLLQLTKGERELIKKIKEEEEIGNIRPQELEENFACRDEEIPEEAKIPSRIYIPKSIVNSETFWSPHYKRCATKSLPYIKRFTLPSNLQFKTQNTTHVSYAKRPS